MTEHKIYGNSEASDLFPVAMAIHRAIRLPITARTKLNRGVRIEEGQLISDDYSEPVLESNKTQYPLKHNSVRRSI